MFIRSSFSLNIIKDFFISGAVISNWVDYKDSAGLVTERAIVEIGLLCALTAQNSWYCQQKLPGS